MKHVVYQLLYQLLIILTPFITSPYIARVLGPENLGEYSYSYSVAYYFVLVSMLGIINYGNRKIAQVRDNQEELNRTFSSLLAVHMLISAVCCIAYAVYVCTLSGSARIYALAQGFFVLSAMFDISWFYFGIEKFKLTVSRSTIIKLVNIVCVFLFVNSKSDTWIYCVIMSASFLLSQIALWLPLRKYVNFVRPVRYQMIAHLKPMFVLFIPALAVSLYKYMDKIMIAMLSSKTQLGFYENAEKINLIPTTIIASFGIVMMPKMSNLAAKSEKEDSGKYLSLSFLYIMCLSFILAFGIAGVGNVFAPVFWGNEFTDCGPLIIGLSVTVPFISFASIIRTQYLIPHSRDKKYLFSVVSGALINLALNRLLIPPLGAMGAVIGTIAAEISVCIIQAYAVRKELPLLSYVKSFAAFPFFGMATFLIIYTLGGILKANIMTLGLQVAIGGFVYATFSSVYFIKTKNAIFIGLIDTIKMKVRRNV